MHPPELSLSEKSRFIKSYYYVWGLLCLQESSWPERLSRLPLRYMYYVDELSRVSKHSKSGPALKSLRVSSCMQPFFFFFFSSGPGRGGGGLYNSILPAPL